MQLPPVAVLLSFPEPNYTDPVTRGPANIIVASIFFPLMLAVVCLRIYTRLCLNKSFGVDDWFILAAMVPAAAFGVFTLYAEVGLHWNRHVWDVNLLTLTSGLKIVIATEILFGLAATLTKISTLLLVYRITHSSSRILSRLLIAAIALLVAEGTAFSLTVLFECVTPSRYWTLSFKPQPQCMSEPKLILASGIVNTATDLIVVILPMPTILFNVKLPLRQQLILGALFGTGLAVTAVGAARTWFMWQVNTSWDKTWLAYPAFVCSSVELYVGVICASIPATRQFFTRFKSRWLSYGSNNSSTVDHTLRTINIERSPSLPSDPYMIEEDDIGLPPPKYEKRASGLVRKMESLDSIESEEVGVERQRKGSAIALEVGFPNGSSDHLVLKIDSLELGHT